MPGSVAAAAPPSSLAVAISSRRYHAGTMAACWLGVLGLCAALQPPFDDRPARPGEWGFRPAEGAVAATDPPAFVWRPQRHAASYEWQLAREAGFERIERRARGLAWNVHCPPRGLGRGRWFWRVRFVRSSGERSAWSRVRSFVVDETSALFALPEREELLSRVPRRHPRLFVRPEQREELRRRIAGDLRGPWRRLLARCERLLRDPPSTEEPPRYPEDVAPRSEEWRAIWWGNRKRTIAVLDAAATLAFARWLGGEELAAHGRLARRLLLAAARWDPRGATGYRYNDEAGMPYAYHFARAYTFLHDLLDEDERALCRRVMRVRGRDMYRHLCPRHLWRPYSSHSNRAWHFLGEVGIAFLGEIPEAGDWVWFAANVFTACYPVWSDAEGGWHEGLAYWRSYLGRFTWWADVMRSALRLDAYTKPFFAHVGDWPLYLQPPGTRGGGFGDLCGRLRSSGNARLMALFAARARNPYWAWYAAAHGDAARPGDSYIDLLRGALPAVTPRPPTDLPKARLFAGVGQAVLNTDLEHAADNVEVIFKSSPFGTQSHGYEAQNSMLLYAYGERLLIRSGYRDLYGSAHHRRWMWSTRSTNSVTVEGHGQLPHSPLARGRIEGFSTTDGLQWVRGEAAGAYGGRLRRFTRDVVLLEPDLVLVHDVLEAGEPSTFEWWWHAETPFGLGERRATVRTGRAGCELRWLAPERLELTTTDRFDPPPRPRVRLRQYHLTARTVAKDRAARALWAIRVSRGDERAVSAPRRTPQGGYLLRAGEDRVRVELRPGGGLEVIRRGPSGAAKARLDVPGSSGR